MSDCDTCLVRNRAICSALMPDELAVLSKLGRKQNVTRGQTLVWEGDESLVVANVIQGVLKLSVSTQDGREQIVGVVFPSDFIGRPFGKESPYGVTALTTALLAVILPMVRIDAVLTATLLSFTVYTCAVLWVFAASSAFRAWLGLVLPAAILGLGLLAHRSFA